MLVLLYLFWIFYLRIANEPWSSHFSRVLCLSQRGKEIYPHIFFPLHNHFWERFLRIIAPDWKEWANSVERVNKGLSQCSWSLSKSKFKWRGWRGHYSLGRNDPGWQQLDAESTGTMGWVSRRILSLGNESWGVLSCCSPHSKCWQDNIAHESLYFFFKQTHWNIKR